MIHTVKSRRRTRITRASHFIAWLYMGSRHFIGSLGNENGLTEVKRRCWNNRLLAREAFRTSTSGAVLSCYRWRISSPMALTENRPVCCVAPQSGVCCRHCASENRALRPSGASAYLPGAVLEGATPLSAPHTCGGTAEHVPDGRGFSLCERQHGPNGTYQ